MTNPKFKSLPQGGPQRNRYTLIIVQKETNEIRKNLNLIDCDYTTQKGFKFDYKVILRSTLACSP